MRNRFLALVLAAAVLVTNMAVAAPLPEAEDVSSVTVEAAEAEAPEAEEAADAEAPEAEEAADAEAPEAEEAADVEAPEAEEAEATDPESAAERPEAALLSGIDETPEALSGEGELSAAVTDAYGIRVYAGTGGDAEGYDTLREAVSAAQSGDTIRLFQTVTLKKEEMPLTIPAGKELTLELNGFDIFGSRFLDEGETAGADTSVFLVEGALKVDALSSESPADGASLNEGGSIRYGNSANTAGGVVVRGTPEQAASFTMLGGSISENTGRVGGIEAHLADVRLIRTQVTDNTGTDVGGIEGTASGIYLGDKDSGAEISGNHATGRHGVGGISVSSDPDYPKYLGTFIATDTVITGNVGYSTGGVEAFDAGILISGGRIGQNWGKRTGGMTLTGTTANIGEYGVETYIEYNYGGFVGGVQVNPGAEEADAGEFTLIGTVFIEYNFGNVPEYPDEMADGGIPAYDPDSGRISMNLALYSDQGRWIPMTIHPDPIQETSEGTYLLPIYAPVGIYTISRDGDGVPEDARMIFQLADDVDGGGDVYALTGTYTTPLDPNMSPHDYLDLDSSYYNGEYSTTQQEDRSCAIERMIRKPPVPVENEEALVRAFAEAEPDEQVEITLTEDITITSTLTVQEGRNISLYLDGHHLKVDFPESTEQETYTDPAAGIRVEKNANLFLTGEDIEENRGRIESETSHMTLVEVDGGDASIIGVSMLVSGLASTCVYVKKDPNDYRDVTIMNADLSAMGDIACTGISVENSGNVTVMSSKVYAAGRGNVPITAVGDVMNSGSVPFVTVVNSEIEGLENGIILANAGLDAWGESTITAVGYADQGELLEKYRAEDPNYAPEITAVYAIDSTLCIQDQSVLTAIGGEFPAIALDLYHSGEQSAFAEISENAELTASGSAAHGLRSDQGIVTLKDAAIQSTGTDTAIGIAVAGDPAHPEELLHLSGSTSVVAGNASDPSKTASAKGVEVRNALASIDNTADILASASQAFGVAVLGGSCSVAGSETRIQADGIQEAAAIMVYGQAEPAEDAFSLNLLGGHIKASASDPETEDSVYAVRVEMPNDLPKYDTPQVYIRPGTGILDGKTGATRRGASASDTGALSIAGGVFTVEPDAKDIARSYRSNRTEDAGTALYEVIGECAVAVIHTQPDAAGSDRTSYDRLDDAWNAAQDGDTIRLYQVIYRTGEDGALHVPAGKTLTLELNGYGIIGDSAWEPAENRSLLWVEGGLLVEALRNTSAADGETLNAGGCLSLGSSRNTAGGVVVRGTRDQNASFVMHGGEISDNRGRVGGMEAQYAAIQLDGTQIARNTGTDVGGIEARASDVSLGEAVPVTIAENSATSPSSTGGIRLDGDADASETPYVFASHGTVLEKNTGMGTGGIAASDGVFILDGGGIEENWGGLVGGVSLTGTDAVIGAEDVSTLIMKNSGGLVGGVQVNAAYPGENRLELSGGVAVNWNYGNVPHSPQDPDAEEPDRTELNLALCSNDGNLVPLTIQSPYPQGTVSMDVGVSIITVVYGGEAPENGIGLFHFNGDPAGDVYALTGTVTTANAPEVEADEDSAPYLWPEYFYSSNDYTLTKASDGAYQLVRESDIDGGDEGPVLTVQGGTASGGRFAEGDEVTVTARTPGEGKVFDRWTWTGGVDLAFTGGTSAASDTIRFLMPGTDLTLTATYRSAGSTAKAGCYVATAVYGSYDCPEVWTLRRFRDRVLARTWYGRLFIHLYYAVSPTAVRLFGGQAWFRNFFRGRLDRMVSRLQSDGFASTPYQDIRW